MENTKPIVASAGEHQTKFTQDAVQALSHHDSQIDPVPLRTFVPPQWIKNKTFISLVTAGASSSFSGSGAGAGASVLAIAHPQSTKPRLNVAPHHSIESLMRNVSSGSDSSV